ncbi:hypothetical protein K9L67_00600 [Candidatus Woesearchaeota archaeon]|nr:hypothetical protein [Candidatus Woesearchaeota archaeon]MCF7900706.1 hypothetical protein [Candidatus Woesearchaeota archaeon]MCF8013227.1 hypothetical protein [Candidatus Woesearchaeota archaeon]
MDAFDHTKKMMLEKLYKPDKSFKGDVDLEAIPIIEAVNAKDDFYTTSSCSGRISLFFEAESGRKDESGWLFVEHRVVTDVEILYALKSVSSESLWFRQEAPIFHIACRDNFCAKKLLVVCRDLGLKHSGIIAESNKRVMVEIIFNNKIDVPVASNGELFVDEKFIKFLVKQANDRFKKNQKLLKKFEKDIIKKLV